MNTVSSVDQKSDSELTLRSRNRNSVPTIECDTQKTNNTVNVNRRKRLRMAPSLHSDNVNKTGSTPSVNGLNESSTCEQSSLSSSNFLHADLSNPQEAQSKVQFEQAAITLNLSTINEEIREVISKYVHSDSVIHCLELAGFTSPYVLACLDEAQLQQVEDFVGHACTLMPSYTMREHFIGPIFAKFPEQFRLPSGTVCGLILAAAEIKHRYKTVNAPNYHSNVTFNDVSTQTDISSSNAFLDQTTPGMAESSNEISSLTGATPTSLRSTLLPKPIHCGSASMNTCLKPEGPASKPSIEGISVTSDAVNMLAVFQAAAVAAAGNNPTSVTASAMKSAVSEASSVGECVPNSLELTQAFSSPFSPDMTTSAARIAAAVSSCAFSAPFQPNQNPLGSAMCYDEEVVDLDRLKQHSSASATRLASRQFLNAHLVRGRDFDMEMEVSTTPEGVKRVTGIFYCHLCREKRERTSAVRFSIARNRYPVLSNVLSHLKTHFQYRGQLFTGSGTPSSFAPSTNSFNFTSAKLPTSFPDNIFPLMNSSIAGLPFMGSTVLPNLGFNAPNYFDSNVGTPPLPTNASTSGSNASTPTPPETTLAPFLLKGEETDSVTDGDGRRHQLHNPSNSLCQPSCDSHTNSPIEPTPENTSNNTFNDIVDHFSSQADPDSVQNPR